MIESMIDKLLQRILIALLILGTSISASAKITPMTGKVNNGYNYQFYRPDHITPTDSAPLPLIVFLHGASLCGNNLEKVKRYGTLDAIARGRKIDAYVAAPQNPGGSWNPTRVMNIVNYIVAHEKVDTTRIYVIGMSLGGYGTIDCAAAYPDRFAAAIAICGGGTTRDLTGLARIPLWIIHGTGDRAVHVSQSDRVVDAVKNSSDSVSRISYDRIHGMNHTQPARLFYSMEVYDWLLKHRTTDENRNIVPTPEVTDKTLRQAYDGLKSLSHRSHRRHSRHRRR